MRCEEAAELLGAYIDGEAAESQRRAAEAHLEGCADCRELAEDYRRMGRQLRAAGREPVPADLARRIRTTIDGEAAPTSMAAVTSPVMTPRSRLSQLRQAMATVAACLLCILGTWGVLSYVGRIDTVERDVLAAHMRALLQDSPVQVASSDSHTVRPWFNGRLEYAPEVKDLKDEGFPLVGGRLDFVDGHRVGALVYKRRLHVINVFMWPQAGALEAAPAAATSNGYNMLHWVRGGVVYWAVSDLNPGELRQLQSLM